LLPTAKALSQRSQLKGLSPVRAAVPDQGAAVGKVLVAEVAAERLVAGVRAAVNMKIVAALKSLAAIVTHEPGVCLAHELVYLLHACVSGEGISFLPLCLVCVLSLSFSLSLCSAVWIFVWIVCGFASNSRKSVWVTRRGDAQQFGKTDLRGENNQ
jgi:hypothetical protein